MSKLKEDRIGLVIDAKTEQAQQELRQLERATADLRKEMKARQRAMLELEAQGKKESEEYRRLQNEVKAYGTQIADNEKKMRSMRSEMNINAMTMVQLRKHAKELQTALNNTSKAANPKEYERLAAQLRNVNGRISDLRTDASRLSEKVGQQTGGIASKFTNMFATVSAGWTKFLGMLGVAVASASALIKGIKWWYNYNTEIEEAQRLTREFTGLVGDELVHVRSQIQAIASTFGKEYKEVLSAVDALMAQYGLSTEEAMKVVTDGLAAGADLGGNMLSMINQYGPAFNDAGIAASELVAMIAQTRSGIFSEGGMAIIQMGSKKIREMSSATAASLDAIGISSKQVEQDLRSGAKNTFDVIRQVSEQLKKLPKDSKEVGDVLKDVFGRQAAAGGLKMIESFADMTTKIEDVKKVTGEYGKLQEQEVETQTMLNEKMSQFFGIGDQGFEEITIKAKIFAMNALSKIIDYTVKIINYFIDLYNDSAAFRMQIEHIKWGFKTMWEVAKLAFNLIIDGFKGMARFAKAWAVVLEGALTLDPQKIADGVTGLMKSYRDTFAEIMSDAKKFGKGTAQNFLDAFNNTVNNKPVQHVSLDMNPSGKKSAAQSPATTAVTVPDDKKTDDKKGSKKGAAKTNSHDDIAAKNFSHDRSQDLDNAKQAYRDDVDALKKALAEKKITQEQYNAYISALNIQHQNNLLAIEESYLQRSNSISISDAEKRKKLQEQQQKALAEQQQAANQAYIEAEKQYYDVLEKIKAAAPDKPKSLQEECDAKLLVLEAYYKASLQMAQENGERHKEVTEAYEKAKADIVAEHAKKTEEEKERARQEYGLDTFQDKIEARRKSLDEDFAKGSLSRQQYNQAIANLEQQSEEHRLQIRQQYGLVSQQELYDAELQQLKMHLQNKELSEEEYEQAKKDMRIRYLLETFNYYKDLVGNAVKSLQEAEIANVNAKYDAEIEAAKNAGRDTADLEKKKANEILKIQKKYADVDFAMQASQIISNTAVAIMGAWATFKGHPVAAGIATGLISAASAAQLAAANAERQKVKKMSLNGGAGGASSSAAGERVAVGLESGGNIDVRREQDGKMFHAAYEPKKRGFVDKPTVIVGEGGYGQSREWVASNAAVNNPTVAPLIDIIDRAQRAGTIRTLDMNKWMAARIIGRAEGGTITQNNNLNNASLPSPAPTRDSDVDKQLLMLLKQLSTEGVPAHVVLSEIEEKQQLRNRARNIARK